MAQISFHHIDFSFTWLFPLYICWSWGESWISAVPFAAFPFCTCWKLWQQQDTCCHKHLRANSGKKEKKKREAQVYVASQVKVKALSWSAVTWGKQFQVILLGIYYSAFSSHCSVRNLALGCNNTCSLTAAHQNVLPSLKAEGEGRGSEILSIL